MKEITESNRLIADEYLLIYNFMGYKIIEHSRLWLVANGRFRGSWDALIPVVDKIKKVSLPNSPKIGIMCQDVLDSLLLTDINHTYQWVVVFIQWYNQQQTDK